MKIRREYPLLILAVQLLLVFPVSAGVTLTTLHSFTAGNDGSNPDGRLAQASNGYFYGTTIQGGGSKNDGVVFKLNTYSSAPIMTSITRSAGMISFTWLGLPGQSYQAQYATNLTQTTWSNLGGSVTATNGTGSETDSSPGTTHRFYRVYLIP